MDLSRTILDLQGQPLIDDNGQKVTFASVFIMACATSLSPQETGEEKYKDFLLGAKISGNPQDASLTLEEKSRLKEKTGKMFHSITVGRCWELLEG